MERFLDGPASAGETLFVDRVFGATFIDRLSKADDGKIGQFLSDRFQPAADLVEFACHGSYRTGRLVPSTSMSEIPVDLHEWVSFDDEEGDTWLFDVTFLTSNYGCIYGRGCPGVFTELAPEYEHGCCTYGAHFVDREDRVAIEAQVARLEPGEWELAERAEEMGGPIHQNDEGEWVTHTIDDACIFLNRPGFEHGAGCALHQAALRRGERPLDWKPDVCWQVPIRFDEHTDDNGHTTYILREWKRRDWGEGGLEFAWWCTDDPLAFNEDRPVWRTSRDEIVELIGEEPYRHFVDVITAREGGVGASPSAVYLPHPQVRR